MKNKKTATVILLEPDDFLAGIYKKKFEMEGLKTKMLKDGEGLFKELKKNPPAGSPRFAGEAGLPIVIVLDAVLPKEDGFKVLEKLKNTPDTKDIPVIFLTSLGQKDDVAKGLSLGADGYLIKAHFRPGEIVDKIKRVLKLD